ncbi:MAG: AraC family transcriptional regulator [Opitutales bacterium]
MDLSKSRKNLRHFIEEKHIVSLAEELFEHLPGVLFFVKDRDRRFVYVNQGLSDMFGLSRKADIIGKFDTEYCDEYADSAYRKDDEKVILGGESIINKVELVTTMNGIIKWHVTSKTPLISKDGSIQGLVGITRELKDQGSAPLQNPTLQKAIDHITQNFSQDILLDDLASQAGLSVSALGRNFKKVFHMTPAQYINRYRVNQACLKLARSQQSVVSIAHDCGFYDQSYFTKVFRSIMHSTPANYRKRYQHN